MSTNSIFKGVYVISLPHKEKRRTQIKAELERVGIGEYNFYKAADGKEKDIRDMALRLQILEPETLHWFAPGHLGCLVSHYTLWLQIFLSAPSDGWYLILEDDARFHASITSEKLHQIWSDLPSEAIFAKLHSSNGYKDDPNLFSEPTSKYWLKQKKLTFSLMAYSVHTKALKTLLMTKWKNHVDLFHIENTYIAARPEESKDYVQTLYTNEGLFSQGICIPNNETDSDTLDETIESVASPTYSHYQLMDGQTYKEGEMSIHLYDELTMTGTCHVYFGFQQKRFTYTD
jgi:GR25 family glycosyltransferase involved in LPS biosynthesis